MLIRCIPVSCKGRHNGSRENKERGLFERTQVKLLPCNRFDNVGMRDNHCTLSKESVSRNYFYFEIHGGTILNGV